MPAENVERKLSAILSADVKGYSRLMGEDEVGTLRMLTAYREVTDALIQQHRGRIVGTAGDGLLTEDEAYAYAIMIAVFDYTQGRLGDKEFLEVQPRAIGK